jgi:hypothetical protein
MTAEADLFAAIDAYKGNTMIAFDSKAMAMRYMLHRHGEFGDIGLRAAAEDTRTNSGLFVMWRDRVSPEQLAERQGNCLWLLEEILTGRQPWPTPGALSELRKGAPQ